MCNLFSNTMPPDAMRSLFAVARDRDRLGNAEPLPAIFPRHDVPVVRQVETGERELVRMHWGFVLPQTSKRTGEPILPKAVNNARDDKLRSSPFWAESFAERRCLVPATSFCEAKGKRPATYYWFGLEADDPDARPGFAFAGLWRHFRGRYRDEFVDIDTVTVVTTMPNDLVRPVHPDRMVVILDPADYATWLGGPSDAAFELLRPYPAARMRIVRRGEDVKSDPAAAA